MVGLPPVKMDKVVLGWWQEESWGDLELPAERLGKCVLRTAKSSGNCYLCLIYLFR